MNQLYNVMATEHWNVYNVYLFFYFLNFQRKEENKAKPKNVLPT